MADLRIIPGFEDLWRPPVRMRTVRPEAAPRRQDMTPRERLARIARGAPEVMVKVTGRTRDAAHLRAHLDYISRNGVLALEDQDGAVLAGRAAARETAADWAILAELDSRRRTTSPVSLSIILSMPRETDPIRLRDAAREFAADSFAGRFDYVMALHTDTGRPHVHLSVRALGHGGQRLNPRKADLAVWRERFAEALRDRGVDAEATPRRARGVCRKCERGAVRKIGDRHLQGRGPLAEVVRSAWREAAAHRRGPQTSDTWPWEAMMRERQAQLRGLYPAQAAILARSPDPRDRGLAARVRAFVEAMPAINSRRQRFAEALDRFAGKQPGPERGSSRTR